MILITEIGSLFVNFLHFFQNTLFQMSINPEVIDTNQEMKQSLLSGIFILFYDKYLALTKNITLLNEDNKSREVAVIHRVLLFTPSIRKHLDLQDTLTCVKQYIADSSPFKTTLIDIVSKYIVVIVFS